MRKGGEQQERRVEKTRKNKEGRKGDGKRRGEESKKIETEFTRNENENRRVIGKTLSRFSLEEVRRNVVGKKDFEI